MRQINWGSWKTTIGGIAGALVALGTLGKVLNDFMLNQPVQLEEIAVAIVALGTAINGIFGRDNDKSSQDVGIR